MKLILTTLISIFMVTTAFSQIGVKGGFSLGDRINTNQGLYYGFDIGVTYDITESIRTEILFEGLFKKENIFTFGNTNYNVHYRILPITVGADYRFLEGKLKPFVGINMGIVSLAAKANQGDYQGDSYFGLYPKAGIDYAITDNILLDLTLKYLVAFSGNNQNNNSNTQVFGANISLKYVFN